MQRRSGGGSNNNKNDDDDDDLFGTAKRAARKFLPTKWFGTDEEKEALARKEKVKDTVSDGIGEMLKGAPLPVQMFGKYVAAPLMGKLASTVAEAGLQQQELIQSVLDDARACLLNDREVSALIGTPI